MFVIRCSVPIDIWVWSGNASFAIPPIAININGRLRARAELTGDLRTINDEKLPMYRSYRAIDKIIYTIFCSTPSRYPSDIQLDDLTVKLYEDIQRIHNRTVEVYRGRLKAWQFTPISNTSKNAQSELKTWGTKYRHGTSGRYKDYVYPTTGGLAGLLSSYSGLFVSRTLHIDSPELEDASEWLEEGKPITVTEELLTQAIEARKNDNLRLAVFNYTTALEQVLQEYLNKKLKQKLNRPSTDKAIKEFLKSDNTRFQDKLGIILPLVIHQSWLKGIDFDKVNIAIRARNKIAHGETVNVLDRFANVDWEDVFHNIEALIEELSNVTLLLDADDDIRALSKTARETHDAVTSIWVYKQHRVGCEVVLYAGDSREEAQLLAIVNTISSKRQEQDSRFQTNKHLTVTFFEYPKKRYATWKAGSLTFVGISD